MKQYFFIIVMLVTTSLCYGQKYISEKSSVSFYSHAPIEDIKADNTKATSVFDAATGEIAFSMQMKDFNFVKPLMQEHFNEKYLDTEKYPKSTFEGKITGYDAKKTGVQSVRAKGKLTLHGVTRMLDEAGTIEVKNNKPVMKSKFIVKLEDYKINRPQLVFQNLAEQVEVTLEFTYKPYEK